MAKNMPHYFRDGTLHKGNMHKMANGVLHSGKTHTASSTKLFHYGKLSKKAQVKAKTSWGK